MKKISRIKNISEKVELYKPKVQDNDFCNSRLKDINICRNLFSPEFLESKLLELGMKGYPMDGISVYNLIEYSIAGEKEKKSEH